MTNKTLPLHFLQSLWKTHQGKMMQIFSTYYIQRGRTCNNPAQLTRSYPPDGHDMHSMSTSVQNQDSFGVLPGPCAEESFVPARDTSCDNSSMLPQSQLTDSLYAPSSQYEQSHLLDQTAALFPMTSAPTMFAETSTGHLYPPPISPCSESLNHPYGSEADWRYSTSAMHNAASTKFDPNISLSASPYSEHTSFGIPSVSWQYLWCCLATSVCVDVLVL